MTWILVAYLCEYTSERHAVVYCGYFFLVLNPPANAGGEIARCGGCSAAVAEQKAQQKHIVDGHFWGTDETGSVSFGKCISTRSAQKGDFILKQS